MNKSKKNDMKGKNGITLIALVVTIIILIILAGISINLVLGENGIIRKASEASRKQEIAETKERLELLIADLIIEEEKTDNITKEDLVKLNSDEIDVGSTEVFPVEVAVGKYKFEVDGKYKVIYVGEIDGTIVTYTTNPNGYTNEEKIQISMKVVSPKGIKTIEYPNGNKEEISGATEKNIQYEVTSNGTYTFKIMDNEGNETIKDIVIEQIDRLAPLEFTPEINKEENNITIIDNVQDAEADSINTKSGIDYYEYYLKEENEAEYKKYETNVITGLETGKYKLYIIAYDKAKNNRQSSILEFEVKVTLKFSQISTGYYSVFGIGEDGNLYTWGNNTEGKLGLANKSTIQIPTKIETEVKFKEISAGKTINAEYCLAIDENGNLWSWGDNDNGKLGNGTTNDKLVPTMLDVQNVKFKKVSAGYTYHSLAIDEEGNIWSWGYNAAGQLGDGTTVDKYTPQKITVDGNVKFKQISAGMSHSLAIDEEDNLWLWGNGENYILCNSSTNNVNKPTKVNIENKKIKEICAGWLTTLILDEDGDLWVCGYNYYGQLGDGEKGVSSVKLKKIISDAKFTKVSEIQKHGLMLDEDGNIWSWGGNSSAQLGNGTTEEVLVPTKINVENVKFKQVSAGGGFSLAIDTKGRLWSWGSDSKGQLGIESNNATVYIPTLVEN